MADDYVIDSTRTTHEVTAAGALKDVMEVSFHLVPEEFTGAVRVPLTTGWPGAAAAAIESLAAEMRAQPGL